MANRKKKLEKKACLYCAKEFQPTRDWQDFCSKGCRWKHWNEKREPILKRITELEKKVKKLEQAK